MANTVLQLFIFINIVYSTSILLKKISFKMFTIFKNFSPGLATTIHHYPAWQPLSTIIHYQGSSYSKLIFNNSARLEKQI